MCNWFYDILQGFISVSMVDGKYQLQIKSKTFNIQKDSDGKLK